MISAKFYFEDGKICGFEISGHATANAEDALGRQLCAAVSSAAYMTANTVIAIIDDECDAQVDDGNMKLICKAPSEKTQTVLSGFKLHLTELEKQYDKRLKIITEV